MVQRYKFPLHVAAIANT